MQTKCVEILPYPADFLHVGNLNYYPVYIYSIIYVMM